MSDAQDTRGSGTHADTGNLVAGLDVPDNRRGPLERHAADARAALIETADWLERELAPRASENEAVGREAYELHSGRPWGTWQMCKILSRARARLERA